MIWPKLGCVKGLDVYVTKPDLAPSGGWYNLLGRVPGAITGGIKGNRKPEKSGDGKCASVVVTG